jgi:hypothetical protein
VGPRAELKDMQKREFLTLPGLELNLTGYVTKAYIRSFEIVLED